MCPESHTENKWAEGDTQHTMAESFTWWILGKPLESDLSFSANFIMSYRKKKT